MFGRKNEIHEDELFQNGLEQLWFFSSMSALLQKFAFIGMHE